MKVFRCEHCDNLVFFENVACVSCGRRLGYVPDRGCMAALDPETPEPWQPPGADKLDDQSTYQLCENYRTHNVCNWLVPIGDDNPYCVSCRLTQVIPDLDVPANVQAWFKLEVAKRRLVYSLIGLRLPLAAKEEAPDDGLAFQFLADLKKPDAKPILTGHNAGVITVNIAEADDAEREKRRVNMREPYRTLLGHFRHETGHYYWDRLIRDTDELEPCRKLFGDDRADYGKALQNHYKEGPPEDWQKYFVSAYASAHPWEDWAETWAHYLHMIDLLETASTCGLSLRPRRADEPALKARQTMDIDLPVFDGMLERWFPLTYVLNNLNRSMGMPDGYPFVLSTPALNKLRFVHEVVERACQI
jgi:hypothetical protein